MYMPTTEQLTRWMSAPRMHRYITSRGDTSRLYMDNAHRSSRITELLLHVEVILRNVVHAELQAATATEEVPWYRDNVRFGFNRPMQRTLSSAVAAAGGPDAPADRVVAELMFGTWRYLLSSQYSSTVWPIIQHGFRGVKRHERSRAELYDAVNRLNMIRNRCAHAEPVYNVPVPVLLPDICTVARYVDPDAAIWLHDLWFSREDLDVLQ